jgi:hypothetical protein
MTRTSGTLFLFFYLLVALPATFAFQVADGTRPSNPPAAKYIFYWGKYQCDLTENTQYKGALKLSAAECRQLLVSQPKVWNGTTLLPRISFKLEGIKVDAATYDNQIATLDAALSPHLKNGNVLHLTDLTLAEGTVGSIDIALHLLHERQETVIRGSSPFQRNVQLNDQFLDRAIWGREDVYTISDRDFFTTREFWQNIRQEPVVEWKSYVKPQALRAEIHFTSKDLNTVSVVQNLDEISYSDLPEWLDKYHHFVHPGAIVTWQLRTAAQYDLLYQKVWSIVDENDPRLRLRRKRDQHEVELVWGTWQERIPEVYLTPLEDASGAIINPNKPVASNTGIRFSSAGLQEWQSGKPICLIDGVPVSEPVSMRVVVADSIVWHVRSDAEVLPPIVFDETVTKLQIDSIRVGDYMLPEMTFVLRSMPKLDQLLVRNDYDVLRKMAQNTSSVKLFEPIKNEEEFAFRVELPGKSPIIFSIFNETGWNTIMDSRDFPEGANTLRIDHSILREPGTYHAFLNTRFGVVERVFEIK